MISAIVGMVAAILVVAWVVVVSLEVVVKTRCLVMVRVGLVMVFLAGVVVSGLTLVTAIVGMEAASLVVAWGLVIRAVVALVVVMVVFLGVMLIAWIALEKQSVNMRQPRCKLGRNFGKLRRTHRSRLDKPRGKLRGKPTL